MDGAAVPHHQPITVPLTLMRKWFEPLFYGACVSDYSAICWSTPTLSQRRPAKTGVGTVDSADKDELHPAVARGQSPYLWSPGIGS